jgi:hypothetical protein
VASKMHKNGVELQRARSAILFKNILCFGTKSDLINLECSSTIANVMSWCQEDGDIPLIICSAWNGKGLTTLLQEISKACFSSSSLPTSGTR